MTVNDAIVESILGRESAGDPTKGYLSKNDRGGRTNWGISEKHHPEEWENGKVPTRERAAEIYASTYLRPFLSIENDQLRMQLVDWCVLHGEGRTRRWVSRMVYKGTRSAGTSITNDMINAASRGQAYFCDALVAWRLRLIDEISDGDVRQKANEEGWENRALEFLGN